MRKGCLLLLALLLVWTGTLLPSGVQAAPGVSTSAEGAALIDVASGRLLYSVKGDKRMRIASLTKIMTAIVAIEHGKLTDMAKVSKNAFGTEGSSIYLKLDEEMNLKDLLYGLMLRSGNDAAMTIAEHVGGSVEGFAYLMNQKAQMLGMTDSSFKNPSGLDADGHYSTANDMAKLTAYALKNPVFQEVVKTKVKKVPNPHESWDYSWVNKNKMLSLYDGADGVKTGYTKLAKRCLVSSATRDGQQLAVVTLNDPNDWIDHARLLDYGFKHYPLVSLIHSGDAVLGTDFAAGGSFSYPAEEAERGKFSRQMIMNDASSTAYRLGEAGRLQFQLDGKPIGSVPLYAKDSPRLQLSDRSSFSFTETEVLNGARTGEWLYILQALTRVLFTGQAD
ncbi:MULTISPECIES: D-alanyl-D-alanine carboxypeptidase family protein [unclassified Paenibacillus]|uniref:D-alanyl-D-alanine carboxypeptidase family protein n=1 Tax=unclassified Paenibacillus TaxID=185978 RepID=UPI001AE74B37|nr:MULTISPECIES: D-alanyl-D-alanine carboxypeptidase family protein [unclassified Paenibacillus]MBP1155213.1 D-alanyl-D-alanine carboxypeptidase [Paenibacillus sp. PvP091]MBP1169403.1 D-alanyl-D-alanine carboxypeptidase [Paenibacillus sp. PvR098]MBP2440431.1 D-alanyl-D-alanine carboxypeptidase [Paenibacillus sp. PvP052]